MKILFINCCIRGEASRTLRLCRTALAELHKKYPNGEVEELNLDEEGLLPLHGDTLVQREELSRQGRFDDPMFRYGRQFAQADLILLGTPYWEYQFPALLRCYLEQISVGGLTFVYGEDGRPQSLCKGKRLLYITTAGGPILDRNCGYEYVKTLCGQMLGIPEFSFVAAETLDVWGADVEGLLQRAEKSLIETIQSWT